MRTWWPSLLWMAAIFFSSTTVVTQRQFAKSVASAPVGHVSEDGFLLFWKSWWWLFVKGWHVTEYFVLTLLLIACLRGRPWLAPVLALAFAVSDEYHQTYVPARGGRWTDVAIDSGGIVLALLLTAFLRRTRPPLG